MRLLSRAGSFLALLLLSGCPNEAVTTPPVPPPVPTGSATTSATATKPPDPPAPKPEEAYLQECKDHRKAAEDLRKVILAVTEARTVANTLEPYNTLSVHLVNAETKAELFAEVHPDAAMRASAERCVLLSTAFLNDLSLDLPLYKAISAVDVSKADEATKRLVERTLRDFKRSGVDKDDGTRGELKKINDELTTVGLSFDKKIREDVRTVKLDAAQLVGLPADYVKAHPAGADGKIAITTDYPDYLPFMQYGEDVPARKELYLANLNRGWPTNEETLKKILDLRRQYAEKLGYASWGDYVTEDKMIKSAKNAQEFIDKITKAADKRAKRDYAELLKRKKKDDPKATAVAEYEKTLYAQKVKKESYAFDGQSVRPYFPFAQTRDGLLAVTAKMYGLEYKNVADAPKWHPDVDVYDVMKDGAKIGRIYLDLHPREGKYKHAANFGLIPGVSGVQLPESVLVCNFPDPKKGEALMDHDDVETMFHEFGHLMHSILGGDQHWVYFSGVATERDFVEAPSQMFEEWAWDPGVLASFAKHKDTHEPIPAELVKKMRHAGEFGKGSDARQQMFYAELSLRLHVEKSPLTLDTTKVAREVQAKYGMFPFVEGTHLPVSFGHLNGYSAIYYTYMWSLVIAKDLLTSFKKNGLMDLTTDKKYRDEILAKGGSKDAAVLVKNFLGRDYDFKAYEAWLNE